MPPTMDTVEESYETGLVPGVGDGSMSPGTWGWVFFAAAVLVLIFVAGIGE